MLSYWIPDSYLRGSTALMFSWVALGCTGIIAGRDEMDGAAGPGSGKPGTGSTVTGPGGKNYPAPEIGPGSLRLLTRAQFENSVRDLLGPVQLGPTQPDSVQAGFASVGATYTALSENGGEQFHNVLKSAVNEAFSDASRRKEISGCEPASETDETCFRSFATSFGLRAWRRPLSDEELGRYVAVAVNAAQKLKDASRGLVYSALGLLSSPNFLYRVEIGTPDGSQKGRYKYGPYELASKLSFLLWNSTPDAELLEAAKTGGLDTEVGIQQQVERLVGSKRASEGIANYARELFELDDFVKKTGSDPRYTESLRVAMAEEVKHLFEGLYAAGSDALSIFDTKQTYVNSELAKLYGISGVQGNAFVQVTLPDNVPRAGVLSTGAFLAKTSKLDALETSPTARGVYIVEQVLCRTVEDPPPGVITTLSAPPGVTWTKRQMLEEHRKNVACAGCHATFDPLGVAFESFDWVGAYRTAEPNGLPVNTADEFEDMKYKDAAELAAQLREHPDVKACFLNHLFRYAVGHKETAADERTLAEWAEQFDQTKRELRGFMTMVAASNEFRYVSVAPPPAAATEPEQ